MGRTDAEAGCRHRGREVDLKFTFLVWALGCCHGGDCICLIQKAEVKVGLRLLLKVVILFDRPLPIVPPLRSPYSPGRMDFLIVTWGERCRPWLEGEAMLL